MATYTQNGIRFNDVKSAGITVGSSPIWTGQTGVDEFGGIINAVDIDWNDAQWPQDTPNNLPSSIKSTGDLIMALSYINAHATSPGVDPQLDLRLTALELDHETLENKVDNIDTTVSSLQGSQNDLTEVIYAIANKVNELTSYINSVHESNISLLNIS